MKKNEQHKLIIFKGKNLKQVVINTAFTFIMQKQ